VADVSSVRRITPNLILDLRVQGCLLRLRAHDRERMR
jgi:hypothetical protein